MRTGFVRGARYTLLAVSALAIMGGLVWTFQAPRIGDALATGPAWLRHLLGPAQTLEGKRAGILVGHRDYDPGTVCADGLTEADVNEAVARIVARELGLRGARVDLLAEFDPRLRGYRADVFVSLHVDSCQADFSGFKVASPDGGSAASRALAGCLWQGYGALTGLAPHPATITEDMRAYHAFRLLDASTPAAILEMGFLKQDRALLERHPERAAAGIRAGIECLLAPASAK
jgi:N-acetylmuramoyl-L-alanine amidase